MPDPNDQQQITNPTYDPFQDQIRPRNTGDPALDAIYYFADTIRTNPNFSRNFNAPRQSQSNVSAQSKWTFGNRNGYGGGRRNSSGGLLDDFEAGIRDGLLDSLAGGNFKAGIQGALSEFTNKFGFQLKDLPNQYGKHLGKMLSDSKLGKALGNKLSGLAEKFLTKALGSSEAGSIMDAFKGGAQNLLGGGSGGGLLGGGGPNGPLTNANAEKLFGKFDKFFSNIGVGGGIAIAVFIACMKPLLEGAADFFKSWGAAVMRDENERKKKLENAQKRLKADLEYIAKEPFEILKKGAEEWYNTWDANLSKVALTQGYTKEGVYELYSSIAENLNANGLGKVIPATDVVNNLGKILETGLSGAIAEAFAYESTWLSAAIPTQDFTSYASTYAQVASDAINAGLSQEEAIAYANTQLEEFASNLLYSSRTLTGGFTTGLKDAQSLFQNAVEIAQTAKTHNVSEISGVLTSVSGVIGSVAPDLAQGLVQNIVQAAIGGNDSSIVALRSLAGINAGNTDFLRQMAQDPQSVFVNIFRNLGEMQKMSPTNYMEVAEGLSSVFGVDMKALARVDFNQLAEKISTMQVNTSSLAENLEILQSGQSTLTADQLRYQEINNDILNNGLAYVIDSEYGRMIQEHMWEEQIANQLSENEYAVNLQGSALSLLEGLRHTVANILSFLNPIGWAADKVAQIWVVENERKENTRQIADILERGAVGSNASSFANLTNVSGADLQLTRSLVELMGGQDLKSAYRKAAQMATDIASGIGNPWLGVAALYTNATTGGIGHSTVGNALLGPSSWNRGVNDVGGMAGMFGDWLGTPTMTSTGGIASRVSKYSGFNVGKSAISSAGIYSGVTGSPLTASEVAASFATDKTILQDFINSAATAATTMTYAEYLKTAKDYGIEDIQTALDDYGITPETLEGYFEEYRSGISGTKEEERKQNIQDFIEENRAFWDYTSGSSGIFQTAMWLPFFGDGRKYDTRMDSVDTALANIQSQLGNQDRHTVISGIEELSRKLGDDSSHTVISALETMHETFTDTFVDTSSVFQRCLADWIRYIAESKEYTSTIDKSQAWNDFKYAEQDQRTEATLALANALQVFSADELQKMDPQLQANALLGEIVIILQAIMQQTNTPGGLNLIDAISAMSVGMTK